MIDVLQSTRYARQQAGDVGDAPEGVPQGFLGNVGFVEQDDPNDDNWGAWTPEGKRDEGITASSSSSASQPVPVAPAKPSQPVSARPPGRST